MLVTLWRKVSPRWTCRTHAAYTHRWLTIIKIVKHPGLRTNNKNLEVKNRIGKIKVSIDRWWIRPAEEGMSELEGTLERTERLGNQQTWTKGQETRGLGFDIISHSVACFFMILMSSFDKQKSMVLVYSSLYGFISFVSCLWQLSLTQGHPPLFSPKSFIVCLSHNLDLQFIWDWCLYLV